MVHARATSVRGPRALCVVRAHAWEAGCRQEAESGKWEEESRKHDFIISCPVPSAGAHMYARSVQLQAFGAQLHAHVLRANVNVRHSVSQSERER